MNDIQLLKGFMPKVTSDSYFEELMPLNWEQPIIKIFGKSNPIPRKQLLFVDESVSKSYSYSGIKMETKLFDGVIKQIKINVESNCKMSFNTALVNLYRNGNDCVGWHSDSESLFVDFPIVVSLSLGSARYFHFRNKLDSKIKKKFLLENGDLLIMGSSIQNEWQHAILKEPNVISPRINITFRNVIKIK